MSSPKVENGYLRIANELFLAALRYQLKQHHKAVYEAILIKTYGFNKKEDDISLSQLEMMTGILASNCSKACTQLVSLNVIHRRKGRYGHIMGINKNYHEWQGWDESWEYWNKDKKISIQVEENIEKPTHKIPDELTEQQLECWELAKKHDYWSDKVPTKEAFLSAYNRKNSGLKEQFENGTLLTAKNKGKRSFVRKSFLNKENNDNVINGECEVINE